MQVYKQCADLFLLSGIQHPSLRCKGCHSILEGPTSPPCRRRSHLQLSDPLSMPIPPCYLLLCLYLSPLCPLCLHSLRLLCLRCRFPFEVCPRSPLSPTLRLKQAAMSSCSEKPVHSETYHSMPRQTLSLAIGGQPQHRRGHLARRLQPRLSPTRSWRFC